MKKHFISVEDISATEIIALLDNAATLRKQEIKINKQLFAANLFFEPSTRTKTSFLVAEKRLGMEQLDFQPELSSMNKGETLYDTVKTFEAIGTDVFIIRHNDDNWAEALIPHVSVPIINAGAGKKDHPTQSLLDAATIYQEFGYFKDLNIVIAGDIKHSRVAHSNAQMLSKLGAKVQVSGAPEFMDEQWEYPYVPIDEAVEIADVLMLLRIQHERHEQDISTTENYLQLFGLTIEREQRMKDRAIVLHPGPVNRGVEIDSTLVEAKRSRIFKQMNNGVFIRMAVLQKQLLKWGIINENHLEKRNETCGRQQIRTV